MKWSEEIESRFSTQDRIRCDCCGGPMRFYRHDNGVGGVLECLKEDCQDHTYHADGSRSYRIATLIGQVKPGEAGFLRALEIIEKEKRFDIEARQFLNLLSDLEGRTMIETLDAKLAEARSKHRQKQSWACWLIEKCKFP